MAAKPTCTFCLRPTNPNKLLLCDGHLKDGLPCPATTCFECAGVTTTPAEEHYCKNCTKDDQADSKPGATPTGKTPPTGKGRKGKQTGNAPGAKTTGDAKSNNLNDLGDA